MSMVPYRTPPLVLHSLLLVRYSHLLDPEEGNHEYRTRINECRRRLAEPHFYFFTPCCLFDIPVFSTQKMGIMNIEQESAHVEGALPNPASTSSILVPCSIFPSFP